MIPKPKPSTKTVISSLLTLTSEILALNSLNVSWKKLINPKCLPAVIIAMSVFIAGCSGHPGTGVWEAKNLNPLGYWMLKVQFDGTATLLAKDQEDPLMGCFWQATAADAMKLQCATADDPENPETFHLSVTTDQATFSKEGKQLALFQRKP